MTAGTGLIGGAMPAQAPQPPPPVDVVSRLRELADLRAEGVLTDAEFETQKQRVLAQ
jgi:Short C-terminal domain